MDGIILIDKPPGITSFRTVDRIKKHFGLRKAGHGGTLDPMATGLLVVLINRATKLSGRLLSGDKEYRAEIKLGLETDSQDIEGRVIKTEKMIPTDPEKIEQALENFRGEILQVPPMFSALKHRGEPLYKIARRGGNVPRKPRRILIKKLEIEELDPPQLVLRIVCSGGTYVRTLAHDLGRLLACGACLCGLRRLRVGPFRIDDAVGLEELLQGGREKLVSGLIRPEFIPLKG